MTNEAAEPETITIIVRRPFPGRVVAELADRSAWSGDRDSLGGALGVLAAVLANRDDSIRDFVEQAALSASGAGDFAGCNASPEARAYIAAARAMRAVPRVSRAPLDPAKIAAALAAVEALEGEER